MQTQMVTPSKLAVPPLKIDLGDDHYDHVADRRVYASANKPLQFTASGTQTYLANGQPYDADND